MKYQSSVEMDDANYHTNLEHMAEPSRPADRRDAVQTAFEDYQALYLASVLREWSAYHANSDEEESIARGYIEYIDKQIREQGNYGVTLYAHTPLATEVLMQATDDWYLAYREQAREDLFAVLNECLIDLWARQHHESVNKDVGQRKYDAPPSIDSFNGDE